ncbi:YkuD_like domain containing protein [Methylophilaceae bacterium]|jgi:murein L,D-transpeptidase YafK
MLLNKSLTYALLTAITLMPWNATAINNDSLGNLFQAKQNGLGNLAENLLAKSLLEITQGKNDQALNTVDELIKTIPNFKLAYLVRGDLLMAQAQQLQGFGGSDSNQTEAIKDLQDEARVRIEHYLSKQNTESVPNLLLAPNEKQRHVIVIDTDKSRLYLYKNNGNSLSYVKDYYVTIGKNGVDKKTEGDKRTPTGVYFAKTKLNQPLADMYGDGAYPLNYPNEWDQRHNRSGSGIWLHGTPSDTYSRPPRSSDGCLVLNNQDLKSLAPILQTGKTPIIIANNLSWSANGSGDTEKQSLQAAMANWLNDWRSQDTDQYLSHYSSAFNSNGINYQQWSAHKYRVQANKPEISITLSNVSIFAYPDSKQKLVVVDFTQDFKSPHLNNKMQKRQYWLLEDGQWKIISEGAV